MTTFLESLKLSNMVVQQYMQENVLIGTVVTVKS